MEMTPRLLKVEQGNVLPPEPEGFNLLFGFHFGEKRSANVPRVVPALGLRPIDASAAYEAWWYHGSVSYRTVGGVELAECDDFVAAVCQVADDEATDIRTATRHVYDELLAAVEGLGPLAIVRAWNYLSRINQGAGDCERYRQFSVGRAEAFEASGLVDRQSPPGTAIGGPVGSPLTVVLLASRHPCRLVENPRQMSAFEYPLDYGPRSPKFSRGGVVSMPCGGLFLISGTAAIIGHTSSCTENIECQAAETFRNLESLLRSAGLKDDLVALDAVRVYLRRREDYPVVRSLIEDRLGFDKHVTYLESDICRRELDLEIDGVVFA